MLTDVERLAALVPSWLVTEDMGREKIAPYADPAKRVHDEAAHAVTAYARSTAIDEGAI